MAIILELLGGLALFLLGLDVLSQSLKALSMETMRRFLQRCSKTLFRGIVSGTLATMLLDSSSATIILLITFVESHVLSLTNAMGMVLGANLGTTLSSQLIAFRIGEYAAIGLFIGVLGELLLPNTLKRYCRALLGFSLIFYGMHLMELAVEPLRASVVLRDWMVHLETPLYGVLIGGLVTLVLQSSSATVGLAIILASQGLMSLEGGIAVMLGAEIGTCSDTLIATINKSPAAVRLGLFHLCFNLVSVLLGVLSFQYLKDATIAFAPGASIERMIANAHVLFNFSGVVLCAVVLVAYRQYRGWQGAQKSILQSS